MASWNTALDRWQAEGLPASDLSNIKHVNLHFLEWEHPTEVDNDSTIVRRGKMHDDTIPQVLEYPVKDGVS